MTKTVTNLLNPLKPTCEPWDSDKLIKWEIREGKSIILNRLKKVEEMECFYCNNNHGHVCRHEGNEYYAWFCSNLECIKKSAEISKKEEERKWRIKNAKDLYDAEIAMKEKHRDQKSKKNRFYEED